MSYASEVLADSPLIWWKLDETSGSTATDSSGNGRHGTYVGSPTLNAGTVRPGVNGVGMSRGSSQRVGFTGSGLPGGNAARTIECWFVPTNADAGVLGTLGGGAGGTQCFVFYDFTFSGVQQLFTDGVNGGNNKTMSAGQYPGAGVLAHAVFTFDGTTWRYYLNGVQQLSGTFSVTINTSSPSFYAGNRVDTGGQGLTGRIGDVALYSTALSASRILAHYQAAVPTPTDAYAVEVLADSPFGFWRLDEAGGTVAVDSSGNGHHGSYNGALALGAESLIGGAGSSVTFSGGYALLDAYNFNGAAGSLEAWVRPNAYPSLQFVIGAESGGSPPGNAFHLRLDSTGGPLGRAVATARTSAFEAVSAGLSPPLLCPPTHLVAVFESSQLKIYTDGALRTTLNTAGSTIACSGIPFVVGANPSWPSQTFSGQVDEVAIYKTALSAARVLAHFQAADPPAPCRGWVVGSVGL